MSLPTYEDAMKSFAMAYSRSTNDAKWSRHSWDWTFGAQLVGPYLDGEQLASLCRASKKCCDGFRPILWSNPFSILRHKKQPVFKHYQFIYLAHIVPCEIRSLVRTLNFEQINHFGLDKRIDALSPWAPERHIRDSVYNSAWFLYSLKLFPCLRFAMLDHLPRLIYQHQVLAQAQLEQADPIELFTSLHNILKDKPVTALVTLSPMLFSFHGNGRLSVIKDMDMSNLLYLDLSWTKADPDSFLTGTDLGSVRVLKLRGCRIGDVELEKWLRAAGQTWCLDVRDNFLTDRTVDNLLALATRAPIPIQKFNSNGPPDKDLFADAPEYLRDEGERLSSTVQLRPHEKLNFSNYIEAHSDLNSFLHSKTLDINDPLIRHTGLTHLLIAANRLSSYGVKLLLTQTNRLQHLDVGSVESTDSHKFHTPYTTVYAQLDGHTISGIHRSSGTRLESLRIHHSVVTSTPTYINITSRNQGFSLPLVQSAETYGRALRNERTETHFSPLQNHGITSLTLTGLPSRSYHSTVTYLLSLLEDCATQESILTSARAHMLSHHRAPPLLSGLRTLTLEFVPEDTTPHQAGGLSVSGDTDADAFLASSEGDFSFFGQDTMSSISRQGSGSTVTTPTSRKGSVGGPSLNRAMSVKETEMPPGYDGVRDVKKALLDWRERNKERWTGAIKIVQIKNPA